MNTYTKDNNEATNEETPATITTARARLEPVPPDGGLAIIINNARLLTAFSMAQTTRKSSRSVGRTGHDRKEKQKQKQNAQIF